MVGQFIVCARLGAGHVGARRRQAEADGARRSQTELDGGGRSQAEPGGGGRSQMEADGGERSQTEPDGARRSQTKPDGGERSQTEPDGARPSWTESDGAGRSQSHIEPDTSELGKPSHIRTIAGATHPHRSHTAPDGARRTHNHPGASWSRREGRSAGPKTDRTGPDRDGPVRPRRQRRQRRPPPHPPRCQAPRADGDSGGGPLYVIGRRPTMDDADRRRPSTGRGGGAAWRRPTDGGEGEQLGEMAKDIVLG